MERRQERPDSDDPAGHPRPVTRVPHDGRDDPGRQPEVSGVRGDPEEHPAVEHMAFCDSGRQGEEIGAGIH